MFERESGEWPQTATLTLSDDIEGAGFGGSIAIDGETALVGNLSVLSDDSPPPTVHVFERGSHGWTETSRLQPSVRESHANFIVGGFEADTALIDILDAEPHGSGRGVRVRMGPRRLDRNGDALAG